MVVELADTTAVLMVDLKAVRSVVWRAEQLAVYSVETMAVHSVERSVDLLVGTTAADSAELWAGLKGHCSVALRAAQKVG